jgi:hypothetical protein
MRAFWRLLAFAAAINLTLAAGVITAQTVTVTRAPGGSTIELALNANTIATVTADATGKATIPVNLEARGARAEADVQVAVDVCAAMRRVILVEPGLQALPPQIGCTRKELPGIFLMRKVTTLLVEVAASTPSVWLRQGPIPIEWFGENSGRVSSRVDRRPSPTGVVLFGGGSLSTISNVSRVECGNVSDCSGKDSKLAYSAGLTIWIFRWAAIEGSFVNPAPVAITGTYSTFRFNSSFDASLLTAAAKFGVPLGPVRIYGQAGVNRHQATFATSETIDDRTWTADDGTTGVFKGGTQTLSYKTAGWGLLFGGGVEVWASSRLGFYAEFQRTKLKGYGREGMPVKFDDGISSFTVGLRLRVLGGGR